MAFIQYDNFTGGLPSEYARIKNGSGDKYLKFVREGGYAEANSIDAFRKFGVLTPGPGLDDLVNATLVDDIATEFEYHADQGKVYAIAGAKVFEVTESTDTITDDAGSTFPYTINTTSGSHAGHSGHSLSDIVIHNINGEDFLMASWNDGTDGDIARLDISGSFAATQNYLSGSVINGEVLGLYPHPMAVGKRNFLFVADGRHIHAMDDTGTPGPYFYESMVRLPFGWVALGLAHYQGFLFIGATHFPNETTLAQFTSQNGTWKHTRVYIWNYDPNSEPSEVDLGDNLFVRFEVIGGSLFAFTSGRENSSKLHVFSGGGFQRVQDFPIGYEPGGSVSSWESNSIIWAAKSDETFQSFRIPQNVYQKVSSSQGSQGGGVMQVDTSSWYVGTFDGAYRIKKIDTSEFTLSASLTTAVVELPPLSQIKSVRVDWEPFSSSNNQNVTITIYANNQNSSKSFTINYQSEGSAGFKYVPLMMNGVNNVQVKIQYPASELLDTMAISRVVVEYEDTNKVK